MSHHIAWFNEAKIEPHPKGGLRSDDKRVERRCLVPAATLEGQGIACSVFGNLHNANPSEIGDLLQKLNIDIVVVGVFSDPSLLKLVRTAKHFGCYILADFADQTEMTADYEKLTSMADYAVASTSKGIALLEAHKLNASLITDDHISATSAAKAWLDCFNHLKLKPPTCANTNTPPSSHG